MVNKQDSGNQQFPQDMHKGYVKLWRKMTSWGWYKDGNTMRVFLHLLLICNHKKRTYMGQTVDRGQCVTGRKALADALGLSERNVRTALLHLKNTQELTIKNYSKFSIATVLKYDFYQLGDQQVTSKRPASDQQVTTSKECKNVKNVKNVRRESFTPPKLEELREYCRSKGMAIDSDRFLDYYSSKGWLVGKVKMKDWKATARNWARSSRPTDKPAQRPVIDEPKRPVYTPAEEAATQAEIKKLKDTLGMDVTGDKTRFR